MDMVKIGAVVLGAGSSSRMVGNLSKLLLNIHGLAVVEHVLRTASKVNFNRQVLVYGPSTSEVCEIADRYNFMSILNEVSSRGMSTSLKIGVRACCDMDGVMIFLGDQPFISTEDVSKMTEMFREHPESIVQPVDHVGTGNPVIIPKALYDEVEKLEGDVGARHIIRNSTLNKILYQVKSSRIHFDIDTYEAYEKALIDTEKKIPEA